MLDDRYILYCKDLIGAEGIIGSQLIVYDQCEREIVRKAEVSFIFFQPELNEKVPAAKSRLSSSVRNLDDEDLISGEGIL